MTDPAAFAAVFDRHWAGFTATARAGPRRPGRTWPPRRSRIASRRGRAKYDPRYDDARPWLYGIATNLLRRWFRNAARRAAPHAFREAGFEDEALGRVEAAALGPALAAALATVASADRALLLHAWAELTYTEIAHATGVPVGTVRSRIHRARTQLRTHLERTRDGRSLSDERPTAGVDDDDEFARAGLGER